MNMMKSEIRDGMQIDWDAPIKMDDGVTLRADIFRMEAERPTPVISSFKPAALAAAREVAPQLPRGFLTETLPPDWLARMAELDCRTVHPCWRALTKAQVAAWRCLRW